MSVVKAKIIQGVIKAKVSPPSICSPSQIQINGANFAEVASGSTLNIPVVNQDDEPIGVIDGDKVVVSDPVLPIAYNYPLTGQTSIQATSGGVEGDDAWAEQNIIAPRRIDGKAPILVDFFTLHASTPNKWGNTNRFTDQLGGQAYENNIFQDHDIGVEIYRVVQNASNWGGAIVSSLGTDYAGGTNNTEGFTDWFLPSLSIILRLSRYQQSLVLNYTPINVSVPLWSSSFLGAAAGAFKFRLDESGQALATLNTQEIGFIFCRLIDQ